MGADLYVDGPIARRDVIVNIKGGLIGRWANRLFVMKMLDRIHPCVYGHARLLALGAPERSDAIDLGCCCPLIYVSLHLSDIPIVTSAHDLKARNYSLIIISSFVGLPRHRRTSFQSMLRLYNAS
jgi:hypothetical protein